MLSSRRIWRNATIAHGSPQASAALLHRVALVSGYAYYGYIPPIKVIGVEPQSVDVLRQSLMSGSRVTIEEPGVDGIWVPQLGEEVRSMHATPHLEYHTGGESLGTGLPKPHPSPRPRPRPVFRSTGCATPWWTMWSASRTMRSARPSEIASKTRARCSSPQALYLLWLCLLWLCLPWLCLPRLHLL